MFLNIVITFRHHYEKIIGPLFIFSDREDVKFRDSFGFMCLAMTEKLTRNQDKKIIYIHFEGYHSY